jgi:DNA-binding CsgD family transcriptional regulator/tetratricopeptide (TPR) repeat protein
MKVLVSGNGPATLVGRSRERSLVQTQLTAALHGAGGLVILGGEAGIGKTSLANDACREATQHGALVLTGHCYDGTNTPPYGPWIELLEQFHSFPDRFPLLSGIPVPDLSRGTSRAALFSEMGGFLNAIARERPLVIVLEDMHWADTASLDLLRVVARRIATQPIALFMTYRSDEVARKHPLYHLLPVLVRESLAVRIDLSPLGDDDVRALIQQDYDLQEQDATRLGGYVQAHAEGNPLFVKELLRSLEGTALFQTESIGWRLGELAQISVPVLLRQVIDARLSRLGDDAEDALAIAAVIGELVPLELWASVCQTTEEALFPLIERATEAHVLDASADGLTVHFSHALIRQAVYQQILPPRRRLLHREIGERLERRSGTTESDEIAYHFSQAGDSRAVVWLVSAGERAQRAFAFRAAAERFESALALLEKDQAAPNERGWLLFRLALLRRFADPAGGASALADAESLGAVTSDAGLVAYARFYRGMLRRMAGSIREGNALTEEGITLLDALSVADRNRLAAIDTTSDPLDAQNGRGDLALALGETGPFARAVELGEHIVHLPLEQTFGSRGDAYYGLAYAYAALGEPAKARSAFASARASFRADGHRTMVMTTLFEELVLVVHPYQADLPQERQRLEAELAESFTTLDAVFDPLSARTARVVSAILEGSWHEVFAIVEQSDLRMLRMLSATLIAPLARHQGNPAMAWSLIHEALPAGPDTALGDSTGYLLPLRMLAVALALDAGDRDAARRWLNSLEQWLEWSGGIFGRAGVHLGWAAYHWATGDIATAQKRAEQALASAGAPRQPLVLVVAHRLLGGLALAAGRLDDADRQFAAALELADTCGARHERAMILLAQAELADARGDHALARTHLADVRSLCVPMGATLTLARADALAARLPATPADDSSSLPANLTRREAEVLRLLSAGLSNAEIADRLSLSARTINAHLTNIYGKLDVSTRGAAIRFAVDHDLS